MNENRILSAVIKSREAWKLVESNVVTAELGSDTSALLSLVGEYYKRDSSAQCVDISLLIPILHRQFSNPKHASLLENVLQTLPDTSPENVVHEILEVKRHNAKLRLATALMQDSKEWKKLYDELGAISTIGEDLTTEEEVVQKFAVADLVNRSFAPEGLIPIWPMALNQHLGGGVRPGHHILVFAPTEMGKTLIVINMLAGWVKAKLDVLYVGNEDPVEDLQMRYINRLTRMTKQEVIKDPKTAQERLEKRGYEHVIFAPLAPGNFDTIQRLVDQYKPKVVVLDQLRNIDVDSENRTQALEKAATSARNLAKRNGLAVVSVAQASDSASGKRILTRGDVDGSNIGIPGQCDVMIGLGGTDEDEKMNMRTFSFPKNKVSGDHSNISIMIDPTLSMVLEN